MASQILLFACVLSMFYHHTHPPGLAKTKTQLRIIVHNSNHFRLQVFQVFIRIYHTPLGNGITAYLNLHLYSRLHCCITIGTLHNHRGYLYSNQAWILITRVNTFKCSYVYNTNILMHSPEKI